VSTAGHPFGAAVFIVDGARTPFLRARGAPGPFTAADLAVQAARALLLRQPFAPADLDEVILGCIMPAPDETNIARVAALRLGCGDSMPAWTVQRNCGSGMQALDSAVRDIQAGRAELVLAGGTEAMSHAPLLFNQRMTAWLAGINSARGLGAKSKALFRFRPGMLKPVIALLRGLTDPVAGLNMGQTAEELAHRFSIGRERMDAYAAQSHQRLAAAQRAGNMREIVPLYDARGRLYDHDDGVRPDSSIDKLGRLPPVFDREFGRVTAGNSSQITDGAAWLVLASEAAVRLHNLPVLGRIVDSEWAGLPPQQMGLGPVHAMTPILLRRRLRLADLDCIEINEAFAAQVLACIEAWKDDAYCRTELGLGDAVGEIDMSRLNVDGGAIALGHPVGASGARIVLHLCHVLARNQARRGMAALCIGGGQGGAMLIERA
jgi:acetyl-CoA C-acetyltransferase